VEAMQVDGCEDVCDLGSGDVELGEQFNLASGNARIHMQFPCDRDEILLEHLQRHNSSPRSPVFGYQIEGGPLFRRRRLVIRVDENIGIEETTSAHESHRD